MMRLETWKSVLSSAAVPFDLFAIIPGHPHYMCKMLLCVWDSGHEDPAFLEAPSLSKSLYQSEKNALCT